MRRLVIVLALAVAMASCRTTTSVMHAPRNFGKVSEGVYRGGQPESPAELAYLQSIGVKSILKLNGSSEPEAERMGFRVAAFAFNAHTIGSAGTCAEVSRAIAFLENRDNWPVYVHCAAGKDRTGYIVGMYERSLGRSIADVMDELHRYGHRGVRAMAFPQIDAELQRPDPRCGLHSESHP
jgi:hypothetical protein